VSGEWVSIPKDLRIFEITVEFQLSWRWLSRSAWPFGQICWQFYKTNMPWSYRL